MRFVARASARGLWVLLAIAAWQSFTSGLAHAQELPPEVARPADADDLAAPAGRTSVAGLRLPRQFVSEPAAPWAAEGRACEGCPPRRVGTALLQVTYVNVLYGLANLVRGQDTAKITPATWWDNMKTGFEWDLDTFVVNQIGHPYQGNNYFTTGRANGLSFWESAGITAFGSGTWEYFGETNRASLNDLINTTLGGIALGEMFHRAGWLVRDTRAIGKRRLWQEIGATALDPLTGANRFLSGDSSRVSEKPEEMVPGSANVITSAGVLWRGDPETDTLGTGEPFLEMDLLYGDARSGRSRTPYEAFFVKLRFGGGNPISEARVRGRLMGQPLKNGRWQVNVSQAYDYQRNSGYEFGAQSFEVSASVASASSRRTRVRASGWGGLTALGAVDSIGAPGKAPADPDNPVQGESIDPRYYDYGPGALAGAAAVIERNGRAFAAIFYEAHHLYSLDGARANHLLQQGRIDLATPTKKGLGAGLSAEYFSRRTYFKGPEARVESLRFPQVRVYLMWNLS